MKGMTGTYNGAIVHGHIKTNSGHTFGGYSGSNTVHQRYIVKVIFLLNCFDFLTEKKQRSKASVTYCLLFLKFPFAVRILFTFVYDY